MKLTRRGVTVGLLTVSLIAFFTIKLWSNKTDTVIDVYNITNFDTVSEVKTDKGSIGITKEKADKIIDEMFSKIPEEDIINIINQTINKQRGTFVTIGDSITARDTQIYQVDIDNPYIGYQQIIKERLNMSGYINLGISGATITRGTDYLRGLTKIAMDYNFGEVDFIIVQAGTNDFALAAPLGDISELTKDEPDRFNFYGAYTGLVRDLKRNNKEIDIFLFTPTQRNCENFKEGCMNDGGFLFKDYVQAVRNVGEHYDVEVIDMYDNFEITQETLDKYLPGGLHPNNDGYKVIGDKFVEDYKKIKGL